MPLNLCAHAWHVSFSVIKLNKEGKFANVQKLKENECYKLKFIGHFVTMPKVQEKK